MDAKQLRNALALARIGYKVYANDDKTDVGALAEVAADLLACARHLAELEAAKPEPAAAQG
jgi:hypothetical protein